jgi:hypothetical protein
MPIAPTAFQNLSYAQQLQQQALLYAAPNLLLLKTLIPPTPANIGLDTETKMHRPLTSGTKMPLGAGRLPTSRPSGVDTDLVAVSRLNLPPSRPAKPLETVVREPPVESPRRIPSTPYQVPDHIQGVYRKKPRVTDDADNFTATDNQPQLQPTSTTDSSTALASKPTPVHDTEEGKRIQESTVRVRSKSPAAEMGVRRPATSHSPAVSTLQSSSILPAHVPLTVNIIPNAATGMRYVNAVDAV